MYLSEFNLKTHDEYHMSFLLNHQIQNPTMGQMLCDFGVIVKIMVSPALHDTAGYDFYKVIRSHHLQSSSKKMSLTGEWLPGTRILYKDQRLPIPEV